MEELIHLSILTPEGVIVEHMVSYVDVPLENGNYGILKNHAPMLGAVRKGSVRYDCDGRKNYVEVEGGILHVKDNEVEILV